MYKAVIFDLNGVFLISEFLSRRFKERFNVPEDRFLPALKEIMGVVRQPHSPPAYSLWKPYLQDWKVNLSEKEFFDFWFSGENLVPELIDYARQLMTQGIKVFILSNNFRERTEYYRRHFPQIFASIDQAYFSWETGYVKPSEASLRFLLTQNHLQPQECIYFDDSEANISVAKKLGLKAEKWIDLSSAQKLIETNL